MPLERWRHYELLRFVVYHPTLNVVELEFPEEPGVAQRLSQALLGTHRTLHRRDGRHVLPQLCSLQIKGAITDIHGILLESVEDVLKSFRIKAMSYSPSKPWTNILSSMTSCGNLVEVDIYCDW